MLPELTAMLHQSLQGNVQSIPAVAPTEPPMDLDFQDFPYGITPAPFAFPDFPTTEVNTAVGIATGLLVALVILSLVYLCAAIWMFVHLSSEDAKLPPNQKVFTECCMLGFILVCFFTPICFLLIYFCVTLGQINDRKRQIVNYNQNYNPNQQMQVAPYNPSQPVQAVPVVAADQVKFVESADGMEQKL